MGNVLDVPRERGLFLSVYVDDKKMVGKKQNMDSVRKTSVERNRP